MRQDLASRRSARYRGPDRDEVGTRAEIRRVALRLFARHGYDGVSLRKIADEVGVHKSSVFHHYRFKIDLAAEVFTGAILEVVERLRPLREQDPPSIEGALGVLDDVVDHLCNEPQVARLLMSFVCAPSDSELSTAALADPSHPVLELFGLVGDWLVRARRAQIIRPIEIREAIFSLIGVVLFHPAAAGSRWAIPESDPFSPEARTLHKGELHAFLRGAFEPR